MAARASWEAPGIDVGVIWGDYFKLDHVGDSSAHNKPQRIYDFANGVSGVWRRDTLPLEMAVVSVSGAFLKTLC